MVSEIGLNVPLIFFIKLVNFAEKLQKDTFIKNAEGVHSLYDLFYVVKIICRMKNWSKVKSTGMPADADNMNEEIASMQKEAAEAAAAQASTSRGKKKISPLNRGIPTLEQTIAILPNLYKHAERLDKSLPPIMDEFLKELCRSFSTFVQFVQPAQFWNKYRPTSKKKARKPKPDESSESENESDGEGTITTMESTCLQNNLSDEDFDDL